MEVTDEAASAVRKLAGFSDAKLSETLLAMAAAYCRERWPGMADAMLEELKLPNGIVVSGLNRTAMGAETMPIVSPEAEKRAAAKERRKAQRRGTKKAIPAPPGHDRRGGQERRKKR